MRDIDQIVRDMSIRTANPIGLVDASLFITGMKKMAEEGMPDTTGAIEGPFTVPLPQAVELIAQMISNEFKTQVYYIFYANMLRGLSHHGLAEEFMEHAQHELEHATYLLRRMSVLSPGGITIPPYPPPEPMTDPAQIIKTMIVVEQMGLSLWKQLHAVMGENPMKYTIEQFLQREEEHQDELWQHVEAMQMPETPTAESVQAQPEQQEQEPAKTEVKVTSTQPQGAEQKLASILDSALRRKQASAKDSLMASLALAVKNNNTSEASKLRDQLRTEHGMSFDKKAQDAHALQNWSRKFREQAIAAHAKDQKRDLITDTKPGSLVDLVLRSKKADFMVPGPGEDTPEQYVEREQQLGAQQALAEAAHAKTIAMQATQAAQQAQAQAQAAQEQLQQAEATVQQLQQQAAQESQQSLIATQQAAEAEARAADHSIQKMQLGMRVNQMRQELANFVMQDPVAESAATVSDLAAQGMPATPMQQAQAEQQAAMGQDPNAQQPSAETQQQVQEAQNAQQHADEQTAEAQQSAEKDKAKGQGGNGTSVTVKTSNEMGTIAQGVRRAARPAAVVAQPAAAPAASGLGALIQKARPYAPHIAAGVGGAALLGGGLALANHARNVGQQPKVANFVSDAAAKASRSAGKHFARGVGDAVVDHVKDNAPAYVVGGLAAGGLAAAHRSGERGRRREDVAAGVAEGLRRAKTASPADRRMMQEILGGETDTLGRSLADIVRKAHPGHAAQHAAAQAAQQAVHEGTEAVKGVPLSELGQMVRPHLPGFAAGAGVGILGTKMMSREQQPAPTPAYYVQ